MESVMIKIPDEEPENENNESFNQTWAQSGNIKSGSIDANKIKSGSISFSSDPDTGIYNGDIRTDAGFHGGMYGTQSCVSVPWTYPSTTSTTYFKVSCQYCNANDNHTMYSCPRVKRVALHPNGTVAEIEFHQDGRL